MTVIAPPAAPYLKPLPTPTELNAPFWEGLRRHEFLLPKCSNCGDYNWVPYPACRTCLSEDQRWTPVSGDAHVFTYTVVHRGPGRFNDEVPYILVLGMLVEQPRPCLVLSTMAGVEPAGVAVGMPITIAYQDIPDEDLTLYRWVPRDALDPPE